MSLTIITNSGKDAVIELEKEIEISASKAASVTLTLVFGVKAKAAVKVLVNKLEVASILPGEAPAASEEQVTIQVAAGQKYEVKKAVGLTEALASVSSIQNTIAPTDIATLTAEGTTSAVEAANKSNQELGERNAKILSLTSK